MTNVTAWTPLQYCLAFWILTHFSFLLFACVFPIFQYLHHVGHFPKLGSDPRRYRWRNLQGLMDAHEIVVHKVDSPAFYRGLGRDPAAIIEAGKAAMRERFEAMR